jgi:hypothetical protein
MVRVKVPSMPVRIDQGAFMPRQVRGWPHPTWAVYLSSDALAQYRGETVRPEG